MASYEIYVYSTHVMWDGFTFIIRRSSKKLWGGSPPASKSCLLQKSFTKVVIFVILVEVFCGKPFGKQARLLLKPVFVTLQAQAVIKCITREKNLACEMRKAEDWYHLTAMQRQEHSYTVLSQSWCLINSFSHVASFCISLLFFSPLSPPPPPVPYQTSEVKRRRLKSPTYPSVCPYVRQ